MKINYSFLVFSLITILLLNVSITSAELTTLDNWYNYDAETRTATIRDLTGEIGSVRLNTPLIVYEEPGYKKTGEVRVCAYENYNEAFKSLDFYDKNQEDWQNHKFERGFDLKYRIFKESWVKDKTSTCEKVWNSTINDYSDNCYYGQHKELVEAWEDYNPVDLRKEQCLDIGIFVNVKAGDKVEWIPNFFGVEIEEFAIWQSFLNNNIWSYNSMNETSGTTFIDLLGNADITLLNSNAASSNAGIIGTDADFNNLYYSYRNPIWTNTNITASVWIKTTATDEPDIIKQRDTSNEWIDFDIVAGKISGSLRDASANRVYCDSVNSDTYNNIQVDTGEWINIWIDFDYNSKRLSVYANNSLICQDINVAYTGTIAADYSGFYLGGRPSTTWPGDGTAQFFNGEMDEFILWNETLNSTERSAYYNNHNPPFINESAPDEEPIIILNLPENNINYTTAPLLVNFSCYANDDINLSSVGLYINGSLDQLNASGINNTNYTFTKTLPEGNYNWTCEGTDNESQTTKPPERIFRIHTTFPDSVIHYPTGVFDYHLSGDPLVFNWTVNESGENLTTHIINCTYNYNGVITELNNTVCTQTNQTIITPVPGVYSLNFTVTDEFGLKNTSTTSWNTKVFEINQSYNNQTIEGNLEDFLATIRLGTGYSISGAVLINYNGSGSSGQSFLLGDNTVLRKTDLLVPGIEVDSNFTFYWNITLSDSTNIALSSNNQSVISLNLDNCSSFTNKLLNMTVVDEEEQTILPNATIEVAVNIYDQSRETLVLNFSNIYENTNPLSICLNNNLTGNSMLSMDTVIRYEEESHANEYYNILNLSLTNETGIQNLILYDLNLNDSTDFQLSFTGPDFLPVENALVYVDRQYISENKFKTVELPKTDYNGQTVLHLVRNDVVYNMRITKDGIILGNFENLIAFCDDFTIGDCNIELNAFDSVDGIFNYNTDLGIIFNEPEYNETLNLVSFNFLTVDGTAKAVTMEVTRNDIFGNRSICNSSLVSSGGTLSCSIDPNLDETILNTNIFVNNILSVKSIVELDSSDYGEAGYLVAFVMSFSIMLFFVKSKEGILISMGVSLASTIGFGLQSGNMVGLGASGVWLLVIIIIGIYKLKKDVPQ